jgi:hypothetical protein
MVATRVLEGNGCARGSPERRPRPWYITTAAREAVGPERRSATLERLRLESVRAGRGRRLEVGRREWRRAGEQRGAGSAVKR